MAPAYIDTTWMGGVEINASPTEMQKRRDPLPPFPVASAGGSDDFVRAFANDQRNSRVNVSLGKTRWEIAWKAELPARAPSSLLLRRGDRLLVGGSSEWYLYDVSGRYLATGELAPGGVTIDLNRGVFYLMNAMGYLAARNLADGSLKFLMEVDYGNNFMHPFVLPYSHFLLSTGIERQRNPHGSTPQTSNLQLMDLGEHPEVDSGQILRSFRTLRTIRRKTKAIDAAANLTTLVISTDDGVYFSSTELKLQKTLSGSFEPMAMSLDEMGNVYMIAHRSHRGHALLGITPGGELFCDVELPGSFGSTIVPPIVGFDHTLYVLFADRIQALQLDGALLWNVHAGGEIAGAVIMPDGNLLVSAGNLLLKYDHKGERTILATFPGEALCSQPLPGAGEEVFVATEGNLYKLVGR